MNKKRTLYFWGLVSSIIALQSQVALAQSFSDTFSGTALGVDWAKSGGMSDATCTVNNGLTLAVGGTNKFDTSWVQAKSTAFSFWNHTLTLSATLGKAAVPTGGVVSIVLLDGATGTEIPFSSPNVLAVLLIDSNGGTKLKLRGKVGTPNSPLADVAAFPQPIVNIEGTKIGLSISNSGGAAGTTKATLLVNDKPYVLNEEQMAKLKPLIASYGSDVRLSLQLMSGARASASVTITQFSAAMDAAPVAAK